MIVERLRPPPENEGDAESPVGISEPAEPASESLDASDLEEIVAVPPAVPKPSAPRPPSVPGSRPPPVPRSAIGVPPLPPVPPLGAPRRAKKRSRPGDSVAAETKSSLVPDKATPPVTPSRKATAELQTPPVTPSRKATTELQTPPITPSRKATAELQTPPITPSRKATAELAEPPWQPLADDDDLLTGAQIYTPPGGVEVGTVTPNITIDEALEAQLEHPTVVDKALTTLGQSAEVTANEMQREIDARAETDPHAAAGLAYELGELYERRLGDETRAVKAYGRALHLDPSLRANLWALRRIFYRREQWPNLVKLVEAELAFARDAGERADLLLEKARIAAYHMDEPAEARLALDEARQLAPTHQGVLLELERLVAKSSEVPALLDVWHGLATAAEYPARKLAYVLEIARAAGAAGDFGRAQQAFGTALELADSVPGAAVRVARENLQAVEAAGTPDEIMAAMETLASVLRAHSDFAASNELRHELVALRRRQAQLVRRDSPEKAWELLHHARAITPDEPLVRLDLTELAEELGRYDALADLIHTSEVADADPARVLAISIRRIDALLRAGQRDEAKALIASLQATAPGSIALAAAAERIALATTDVPELAKTYLDAAQAAERGTWVGPEQTPKPDAGTAAALYIQAAELFAYHRVSTPRSTGDSAADFRDSGTTSTPEAATAEALEQAKAALTRALEIVPHHPVALEALVELEDNSGHLEKALDLLRQSAALATSPEAKRFALDRAIRIARCHGDLEAVVEFERELRSVASDRPAALWHLEATLAQLGRDDERADLLVEIAAAEADAQRRGTALFAAARLRERAGAVEAATDLYRQVLAVWPDDVFARESLTDLLRAQERWAELVSERRSEAKALPDGPAARRALREAAWVLEIRLGDRIEAARVYSEWSVRFPDDRLALEGGLRCRVALGDLQGAAELYAALAEAEPAANTQWLYARALERIAKLDDAFDAYRALAAVTPRSVASTAAAVAVGELAVIRGAAAMRGEALAALSDHMALPQLRSGLMEGSGWISALGVDELDRASHAFAAAADLDANRSGPHLGAVFVALRRGDTAALAHAYHGLAETVRAPDVAAALWLRSAWLSTVAGDLDAATRKFACAVRAAPDDPGAVIVAADARTELRVEASDPFAAVDPLLTRADALKRRATVAEDVADQRLWELDRAELLERAGRLREAGAVITDVLRATPNDVRALFALRRMALRAGDQVTTGKTNIALARLLTARDTRLALLREAAAVFDDPAHEPKPNEAVAIYALILAIDDGAPEFERLFELLRVRGEPKSLLRAITGRLAWLRTSSGAEQGDDAFVALLLERAAVMCRLGDRSAASADLDALLERVPNQVEALRFRGDLAADTGDVEAAIRLWRQYVQLELQASRRSEIESRLAQFIAEASGDLAGAIEQLERVVDANRDDPKLLDQLVDLCSRAGDWPRVAKALRHSIRIEPSLPKKARHELELGKVLRDRIRDVPAARLALQRARDIDPANFDIVRELADVLEPSQRTAMLAAAAAALRDAIAKAPGHGELYQQLSQVNALQDDSDARWLSLVCVEALGRLTEDDRQHIARGRAERSPPGRVILDEANRARLRGNLGGPLAELWRLCAPAARAVADVDAWKLGFAKTDKIAVKKLGDSYPAVSAAVLSFGLSDIEVYVSASRPGVVRALAGEPAMLCVGADVATAVTAADRFHLGRAVATIAEGMASLDEFEGVELARVVVAALLAVDAQVPRGLLEQASGQVDELADRAKQLKKQLSRKARARVTELAQHELLEALARTGASDASPEAGVDVDSMRRAAFGLGCRAGLTWCGDLAVALEILDVGGRGRYLADWPAVLDLVAWSVSQDHMQLRQSLAIGLKARRP